MIDILPYFRQCTSVTPVICYPLRRRTGIAEPGVKATKANQGPTVGQWVSLNVHSSRFSICLWHHGSDETQTALDRSCGRYCHILGLPITPIQVVPAGCLSFPDPVTCSRLTPGLFRNKLRSAAFLPGRIEVL
jgi:hypothetical protein